jgi:hypothetical protein
MIFNLNNLKLNKIETSVPQPHWPHPCVQQLCVAEGYSTGQHRYRTFLQQQKIRLHSTTLDEQSEDESRLSANT